MAGGSSIARFGFDTSCVVTSIDQVETSIAIKLSTINY